MNNKLNLPESAAKALVLDLSKALLKHLRSCWGKEISFARYGATIKTPSVKLGISAYNEGNAEGNTVYSAITLTIDGHVDPKAEDGSTVTFCVPDAPEQILLRAMQALGINPEQALQDHDIWKAFAKIADACSGSKQGVLPRERAREIVRNFLTDDLNALSEGAIRVINATDEKLAWLDEEIRLLEVVRIRQGTLEVIGDQGLLRAPLDADAFTPESLMRALANLGFYKSWNGNFR